jgi:glutaminyl-peptide cyclotransferase
VPRALVCAGVLAALFACSGEPQLAGQAPSPFDSSRAWEHLRRQVAFGPRPAGSAALAACRRYILDQLASVEVAAREQIFEADTPLGPITMVNVIATIPGSRPDRLAIGSHYDTKLFREFRFVGASDGASSTAVLLELARVLKSRRNPMTIELIFFDGEEATVAWEGTDHTYGSRHYVQAAQKAGMLGSLKAFILLDLVGDRRLNIRRDTNSTDWLVDTIWSAATRIGHGASFSQESFTVGGDDHFPFLAAGVPSVDIIDLDYAAWHRPEDTLDAVSARSLQITGEVVLEALPEIEKRLTRGR